ncbi:MAG: molecular chaperone DnaJ [Candidatus Helarchaeota archaeon]
MSIPHDIYEKDLYKILDVEKNASQDEIKRKYRQLARKYHPDINKSKDAEEKFKEINIAYEILSDPQKRRRYDAGGMGSLGDLISEIFGGGFGGGFGDFFGGISDFFSGSTRRTERRSSKVGPVQGQTIRYNLRLTLEEAFLGGKKTISVPRSEECPECGGTGTKKGTKPIRCDKCNGTGEVKQVLRRGFIQTISITSCPKCQGDGMIIKDPCKKCNGKGYIEKERNITITIPKGVYDGFKMKLRGEGMVGLRGGPPGDLIIVVSLMEHKIFLKDGQNILLKIPITYSQAALGDTIEVPTLDSEVGKEEKYKLKIPAGTQFGDVFRIKEKGFPILRKIRGYDEEYLGRGDQIMQVYFEVPKKLTKEQKEALKKLRSLNL